MKAIALYFLIFYLSIQITFSEEINIPNAVCEGNTLKYSISADLSKYLETLNKNKSEIENKTIYESKTDLEGKKIGVRYMNIFTKKKEK